MVAYLPHQNEVKEFDSQNSVTKRTIPSVTVGVKLFKLEVNLWIAIMVLTLEGNANRYTPETIQGAFRVILSNGEVHAVYQMLGEQVDLLFI